MQASTTPFHQIRLTGAAPVLLPPQRTGAERMLDKAMHTHPEGQFYFATGGLMVVETAQGRSITRHFREETGMSVVEWRQAARLQRALELLADGDSVTGVALTLATTASAVLSGCFARRWE